MVCLKKLRIKFRNYRLKAFKNSFLRDTNLVLSWVPHVSTKNEFRNICTIVLKYRKTSWKFGIRIFVSSSLMFEQFFVQKICSLFSKTRNSFFRENRWWPAQLWSNNFLCLFHWDNLIEANTVAGIWRILLKN